MSGKTLIRARQRAVTAVSPHNANKRFLVPNRPKLGPKTFAAEGEAHTVTLTGPSQEATVAFPVDSKKRYRVFWTTLSSTSEVYTPVIGLDEQFQSDPGTFPTENPGSKGADPVIYGYSMKSATGGPTDPDPETSSTTTAVLLYLETAAEVEADFSVTYGNFYVREVLA